MSKIEVGQVFTTNEGGRVVVLEYRCHSEVIIQHQDDRGYTDVVEAGDLRRGAIKNPFKRSVYGVGYVGVGTHRVSVGGKHTRPYVTWKSMLSRAYCSNYQKSQPTYVGCLVNDAWHDYQSFAAWYDEQPNAYIDGFDLDKDLIVLGNKVYSPDTCSLVPKVVNNLLTDSGRARGDLPQGVTKRGKKYEAKLSVDGASRYLGVRSSPEEAYELYKYEKVKRVRAVAEQYRNYLHPTVYKNLMEWELV